jgi:hypothetical protein
VLFLIACGPQRPVQRSVNRAKPTTQVTLRLPGACVDPTSDAISRLGPDADTDGIRAETIDLDGDGKADPMVTHISFCATGGCTWQLYVGRGACAHHVGELFGLLPIARTDSAFGLFELEITEREGCGGLARKELRVRFDGSLYTSYLARRCRCPEAEDDASDDEDPEKWCGPWRPATAEADLSLRVARPGRPR